MWLNMMDGRSNLGTQNPGYQKQASKSFKAVLGITHIIVASHPPATFIWGPFS